MNKAEFVAAMAEKAGLSKKDAEKAVKAFTEIVSEELAKGEKIEGRNPRTGENMAIAASKTPKFKAGKALKDLVNA